jgi:hypothetical protein
MTKKDKSRIAHITNEFTSDEASDLILAEAFGWEAFGDKVKAAVHCKNLQPLLKKYNAPMGEGDMFGKLLEAWNKGHQSASIFA